MGLKTPVAFLVFNRPETTAKVFAAIRHVQPETLLVVADGPRPDRVNEATLCDKVRNITEQVDWPCRVLRNYSEINMGCKKRISSGIDWVFDSVEEAIILEDDCLPDDSFFPFCEELLAKFRFDERVGHISGVNFQFGSQQTNESYYFSRYPHVWGWASWRRAWQNYDVDMKLWPSIKTQKLLSNILVEKRLTRRWGNIFESVHSGEVDTWDYQWVFTNLINNRLSITPSVNLVSNIGFGATATHTQTINQTAEIPTSHMTFPLRHLITIIRDSICDHNVDLLNFPPTMLAKIKSRLISTLS